MFENNSCIDTEVPIEIQIDLRVSNYIMASMRNTTYWKFLLRPFTQKFKNINAIVKLKNLPMVSDI